MDEEATDVIHINIPAYVGEDCNNSHTRTHTQTQIASLQSKNQSLYLRN